MCYVVYILYSRVLDKFYVGSSGLVELRVEFHQHPLEKRKFTARGSPWELVLELACDSKEHALRLERFIKRMKSADFIRRLIASEQMQKEIINKTRT